MMEKDDIFEQLASDYGLLTILEQNDISEARMLELLYMSGQLDLDDYLFSSLDVSDED